MEVSRSNPLTGSGHEPDRRELPMRRPRRLVLVSVALTGALVLTAPAAPAAADPKTTPPTIVVSDGMTQPVFSFADAIEERVCVQTPLDTDHDGRLDRVAIDISRPARDRHRGLQGAGDLRAQPVPQGHLGRCAVPERAGGRPAAERLCRAVTAPDRWAVARPGGQAANLPGSLDDYYVPARLRRGARPERRHRRLGRLPDQRRPGRDARHQGGHRLAQRPGQGLRRRRRAGQRRPGPPARSA